MIFTIDTADGFGLRGREVDIFKSGFAHSVTAYRILNFHVNCHGLVGRGFPVNSTGLRPRAHKLEVVGRGLHSKAGAPDQ